MNPQDHEGGKAIRELVDYWKIYQIKASERQIHPSDDLSQVAEIIKRKENAIPLSAPAYFAAPNTKGIHTALSPVPYLGKLKEADLVLLMINPSVTYEDYVTQANEKFQKELKKELYQERQSCLALDPEFSWTSWFKYYEILFRKTLLKLVKHGRYLNYSDALTDASKRLAILELVPYSSENAAAVELLADRSPSSLLVKAVAQEFGAKACSKSATVIVRWSREAEAADRWGLGKFKDCVKHSNARSGLSEGARIAMYKQLKKQI